MPFQKHEADRLVENARWIVLRDTETDGCIPLGKAGVDELNKEPSSYSLVPTRRDDRDRQLGDILGDEAIAMARLGVRAIPGRAHRPVLLGNYPAVAEPRPSLEVHRITRGVHHLLSARRRLVWPPNCSLAEHRREERIVISSGRSAPNVLHAAQFTTPRDSALPDEREHDITPATGARCA